MADAIDREQARGKMRSLENRTKQWKDGSFKSGYKSAVRDAIQKISECDSLETDTVTRCRDCRHASEQNTTMPYCTVHNRRRAPDDFCNFGERQFE